tara:strand:- start:247 stop:1740 length:1494 start_codon:yes stop_codon:yes gene_type:complete
MDNIIILKKEPKTILTKRGYAIVKKYFTKEIPRIKKELHVRAFISSDFGSKSTPFPIFLESEKKLYIPKHYAFKEFGNPDLNKLSIGETINLNFIGELRPKQIPIVNAYLNSCGEYDFVQNSNGGIISVPCGWGKTIMALNIISKLNKKTLIVVHKEFLLNQWKERIKEFLPDARVGLIQAGTIDVENKDIVISMLQSVSKKKYANDVFSGFGLTIVDECHHIGAEVFSRALPKINSYYSLGLSATPNRKDGLSKVFKLFLGPIVYKINKSPDKLVDVNVINFRDIKNTAYNKHEITRYGKMCLPKMITNISNNNNRNLLITCIAKRLVNKGKQVIILSDRRMHLEDLYKKLESFCTVGYYKGGMKQKDLDKSESCKIILGTYSMSAEGLDIPSLDAVIFTTPKSSIQQSIGRITRKKHKELPIAYDIVDQFSMFPNQYKKREKIYKRFDYNISVGHFSVNPNNINEHDIGVFLDTGFTKVVDKKTHTKKKSCLINE